MNKSLFAVVFLAGVSFASAQTTVKTEVKPAESVVVEVNNDTTPHTHDKDVATTPTFKKDAAKVKGAEIAVIKKESIPAVTPASPAIKQETVTEIKEQKPAVKP